MGISLEYYDIASGNDQEFASSEDQLSKKR